MNGSPPSQNVSISQSEVTSKQASTEEEPWLSSPKDTIFPETIPEESSSTEEEHVVRNKDCNCPFGIDNNLNFSPMV